MEASITTMRLLTAIKRGEHLIYNRTERAELEKMLRDGLITIVGNRQVTSLGLNYTSMPFELTRKGLSLLGIKPAKNEGVVTHMDDPGNTDIQIESKPDEPEVT